MYDITTISKTTNNETAMTVELFSNNNPKYAGKVGIWVFDEDSLEHIYTKYFPTLEAAEAEAKKALR